MIDPRPLYRELTSGTVGPGPVATVQAARRAIHGAAADLDDARTDISGAWTGVGARAAHRSFDRRSAELCAADAELGAAIELLDELAAEQARVQHAAAPLIQWWCRSYVLAAFTNPVLMAVISARVCTALTALRATHRAELARIAAGFDRLAGGAAQALPAAETLAAASSAVAGTSALPPLGTSPRAVAEWWKTLSPSQQAALQATHPDALAELDGLPPIVLDAVNRARLERDRAIARAQLEAANDGLRAHGLFGMPDTQLFANADPAVRRFARDHAAALALLDRADQTDAAVRSAQAIATDPRKPPIGPVLLLAYRNTGAGGLAIAFGDPSKAHDVAVAVPGTGAGPRRPGLEQASALRREMDRRDPGGSHATVEWVDYDAPDAIASMRVTTPAQAHEGAARLVGDVAGWRAAAGSSQHVTVVGHSYGSTLVGLAGQRGLAADDIAFVGSPGVGASSADGLSAGRGHVWAGSAEHDPVVQVTRGNWFTENGSGVGPYDKAFGARQFDTTSPGHLTQAHSSYYTEGSPSLQNLARISTGDYGDVTGADLNKIATANPLRQVVEASQDAMHGVGQTVADLATGHPQAALKHAVSTFLEHQADTVDILVNGLGTPNEHYANLRKTILGWVR